MIELPTSICEGYNEMMDILPTVLPHIITNDAYDLVPDEWKEWCSENIGLSLYTIKPFKNGRYKLRSKNGKWDYWCNIMYFKDRETAMRFKLVFGGDYEDSTNA